MKAALRVIGKMTNSAQEAKLASGRASVLSGALGDMQLRKPRPVVGEFLSGLPKSRQFFSRSQTPQRQRLVREFWVGREMDLEADVETGRSDEQHQPRPGLAQSEEATKFRTSKACLN